MRNSLAVATAVAILCATTTTALPSMTSLASRQAQPVSPIADGLSYTIPPPPATGGSSALWQAAFETARGLVEQMTLEEKVKMATGQPGPCIGNTLAIPRLGIPALCMSDGPAGVRPALGVTQFPAGVTTAATWDRELFYNRSLAMGQEFRDQGVHIAFGPVTGGPLGRAVLNGRTFEGFAADPYAAGEASYYAVKGIQDAGVIATAKHFISYEQEGFSLRYGRANPGAPAGQLPYNSIIDDKTTHEMYLWPFADAVRAGVGAVMCSYNLVNGTHSCANSESINGLLKTELDYQGMVLSDYGSVWGTQAFAQGGLDISTPGDGLNGLFGKFFGNELLALVGNGTIDESRVQDQAIRVLTPYFALGQQDDPLPPPTQKVSTNYLIPSVNEYRNVQKGSTVDLVRRIGEEGAVLLKNTGGLPLQKPRRMLIVGEDAGYHRAAGDFGNGGPINTFSLGFGSGYAIPNNLIDPLAAISMRALQDQTTIESVLNNTNIPLISSLASQAEVALVFSEALTGQGTERRNLNLTRNGTEIILSTAARCSNTVVVLHLPGAANLEAFVDHPNITAILAPMLPGEQTGTSLVRLLYGDVNPSGKLPFTIGKSLSDYPPNTVVRDNVVRPTTEFTEKSLIDYRWFDAKNIEPRYEYGFGLSYSTFAYNKIRLNETAVKDNLSLQATAEKFVGQKEGESLYDVLLTVHAEVENSGKVFGCEVAQLYVEFPSVEGQPPRNMRGFDKVKHLEAGDKRTASFPIRRKDVSVWDTVLQMWRLPAEPQVVFHVGSSSRKLPLKLSYNLY